jgi:hypothetical protein
VYFRESEAELSKEKQRLRALPQFQIRAQTAAIRAKQLFNDNPSWDLAAVFCFACKNQKKKPVGLKPSITAEMSFVNATLN